MTVVDIAEVEIRQRVRLRDDSGRFLSEVRQGAAESVEEIADHIAAVAITNVASRLRTRSGELLRSISVEGRGFQADVVADAGHAAPQEKGAVSHNIPNSFGRGPDFGFPQHRNNWARGGAGFHPGNPAVHFLRDAGEGSAAYGLAILRKNMPG